MNKLKYTILVAFLCVVGAMTASAQEEFARNLETVTFVPKGQWITGASINYSQSNLDNYKFFIVEDVKGDLYTFKVTPTLMYSFKDDNAVGGKFGYSRSRSKLDNGSVVLDPEMGFSANDLYLISQDYMAMGVYRYYFSLGRSKRFGMFAEMQVEVGLGQSKLRSGAGNDITGTFQDKFSLNIGVAPGMTMFLNNFTAIEVNVGMLGLGYNYTKQTTDQIYISDYSSAKANLKLNLLSISFGVLFYL